MLGGRRAAGRASFISDAGPSDASAAADGGGSAAEGPMAAMAASASASKIPRLQDSKSKSKLK